MVKSPKRYSEMREPRYVGPAFCADDGPALARWLAERLKVFC